jgi:alanine racemase
VRPSWVEVDLDAIESNVAAIAAEVAPSWLCAVVKADAYGHGDVPVAEAALAGGASWLGVALVSEGARLREAGVEAPILVLSEPAVADAADLVRWRLRATAYRPEFVAGLAAAARDADADPHPVHVKLDSGMHRVGADHEAALSTAAAVTAEPALRLEGLWTHLAVADEDADFTQTQIDRFDAFLTALPEAADVPIVHAANTAGALAFPKARYDLVRVGLGIYGLRPEPTMAPQVDLVPAMRVVSEVTLVRRLAAGSRPSYGRSRALPHDATVATVPIGYADGVARRLGSTGGGVLIRGKRYPFAGTVTMDQLMVDVGDDPVEVGDEVVLLGSQDEATISAEEWATRLDTINYEIVCDFGPRLPRRYKPRHT